MRAGARDAEFEIEFGISIWELAKEASLHFARGGRIRNSESGNFEFASAEVRGASARRSAEVGARLSAAGGGYAGALMGGTAQIARQHRAGGP